MMKAELIPTVRSLLAQNAISVGGDEALITRLESVLFRKEYISPYFTYEDCFDEQCYELDKSLSLADSINRPITKQVLYSIDLLPERFTLTVHIHNATGCVNKTIYTKLNPNLNHLGHTFNALYRRLDESQQFMVCCECQQLVDTELCNGDVCGSIVTHVCRDKQNAHQPCSKTFKQTFNTNLIDRISRTGDVVSVFKDEDDVKFHVPSTAWLHPHSPFPYDRVIDTLPLNATLDEVNVLRLKLEAEQQYPAPCYHCKAICKDELGMDLASFVDFKTNAIVCYGCASTHYGIVY